jgi:hypothetical protein
MDLLLLPSLQPELRVHWFAHSRHRDGLLCGFSPLKNSFICNILKLLNDRLSTAVAEPYRPRLIDKTVLIRAVVAVTMNKSSIPLPLLFECKYTYIRRHYCTK